MYTCIFEFIVYANLGRYTAYGFWNNNKFKSRIRFNTNFLRKIAWMLLLGSILGNIFNMVYLYSGMGYDWAGHLRLKHWPRWALALAISSSMLTFGGTLPIGSKIWFSRDNVNYENATLKHSFIKQCCTL